MTRGTTIRSVRVSDDVWIPAQTAAADNGDNLSEIIREALIAYTASHTKGSRS